MQRAQSCDRLALYVLATSHGRYTISVLCQQGVYEAQYGVAFALLLILSERARIREDPVVVRKAMAKVVWKYTHVSMISCTRPPSHFPRSSSASKAFAQEPMPSPSSVRDRTKSQRRFPAWSQHTADCWSMEGRF